MNRVDQIKDIKGLIIDLDGVVWQGEDVILGSPEAIQQMKAAGKRLAFVSNNSTMSRETAVAKLKAMGIEAELDDMIMAPYATARYINGEKPGASVLVVGLPGLAEELAAGGLRVVSNPEEADYVVAGNDRSLTYEKLTLALRALLNGAKFVATNDDGILPTEQGFFPGAGATVGAIQGMIKREPDVVIGKPNGTLIQMALATMNLTADQCVIIGDSLMTDILIANRAGIFSILVLSGNTKRGQVALPNSPVPNCVLSSISEVPGYLFSK